MAVNVEVRLYMEGDNRCGRRISARSLRKR